MSDGNVIWVDFRLSKDIRERQVISFAERMQEHSARTQAMLSQSRSALEIIKLMSAQNPD